MPRRRSVWISHKNTPLFGLNLSGYGADAAGIHAELEAAEEDFCRRPGYGSFLVALDLAFCDMLPELAAFINSHNGQPGDPIRKLAVIGVPWYKRLWYQWIKGVRWPKHARFFDAQEPAKAWLISERN